MGIKGMANNDILAQLKEQLGDKFSDQELETIARALCLDPDAPDISPLWKAIEEAGLHDPTGTVLPILPPDPSPVYTMRPHVSIQGSYADLEQSIDEIRETIRADPRVNRAFYEGRDIEVFLPENGPLRGRVVELVPLEQIRTRGPVAIQEAAALASHRLGAAGFVAIEIKEERNHRDNTVAIIAEGIR